MNDTIERLEKHVWAPTEYDSYLVTTCHALRKKPLPLFEIEDLRIMIGQGIGMDYLVPLAIEQLKANIFAEGHFYAGDLLKSILTSHETYWLIERKNWKAVCDLVEENMDAIKSFHTIKSIKEGWLEAYTLFKSLHKS